MYYLHYTGSDEPLLDKWYVNDRELPVQQEHDFGIKLYNLLYVGEPGFSLFLMDHGANSGRIEAELSFLTDVF